MKFKLTTLAALLTPVSASADPVTIATSIASWVANNVIVSQIILTVATAAYGQYSARRAAKRAEQAARDAYNANLEDRTATIMTSTPSQRVIYGRAVCGGDVIAMFTTDKHGVDDNGNPYTKPDGLKHLVVHVASHQSQAIHDTLVAGVKVGAIDSNGWATQWTETRSVTVFGPTKLPYKATSIVSASNGTTDYSSSVSLSADGRTINSPAGVRIKVKYVAVRDDFCTGDMKLGMVGMAPGASVTVPDAPISIVDQWVAYNNGEVGDAMINYNLPDNPGATISGNTISNSFVAPGSGVGYTVYVRYTYGTSKSVVRLSYHLGAPGQVVDAYLNGLLPDKWTTDHKLEGLTWVLVTLDLEDQRFQSGPPQLSFDVSGRLIYDPRSSTTAWTDNAALIINDFLVNKWGYNCEVDEIDQSYLIQAANDSDISTTFKEVDEFGAITTTTGRKYTINGGFSCDNQNRAKILDDMALAMAGYVTDGPQWMIQAGVWTTPVQDISDDWLAGSISIVQCDVGLDEVFNTVRGTYMPLMSATEAEYGPYSNPVHVTADGEELATDLPLPFTNTKARCVNIARIVTERMRTGLVISYPAKTYAWPLRIGERVRVTSSDLGFVSKTFRVTDWQNTLRSPVLLTLREDVAATYDEVDSVKADPTTNVQLANPWRVESVGEITITSGTSELVRYDDGTVVVRARVTWQRPSNTATGKILLTHFLTNPDGSLTTPSRQTLEINDTVAYITGLNEGDRLTVRISVVNDLGAESVSSYKSAVIVGKSAPPSNVTGLAYSSIPAGAVVSWTGNKEADYGYTVAKIHPWTDSGDEVFRGSSDRFTFSPGTPGTYTLAFKHFDSSGNPSVSASTLAVVVGAASTVPPIMVLEPQITTLSADETGYVQDFTTASSKALVDVGGTDDTASWTFTKTDTGVISNLGGVKGNIISITGFNPSLANQYYSNVILQLHFNGDMKDSSKYKRSGAAGSSLVVSSAQAVFGSGSLRPTGGKTGLSSFKFGPDPLFRFAGMFTIKARIRVESASPSGMYLLGNEFCQLYLSWQSASSKYLVRYQWYDSSGATTLSTSAVIANDTWYAICITKDSSGYVRVFVDGVLQVTSTTARTGMYTSDARTNYFNVTDPFNGDTFSTAFYGYIDEVVVLNGVCLHTANYTVENYQTPDAGYYSPAYVDVTASKAGQTPITKRLTITTTAQGSNSSVMTLDRPSFSLNADYLGVVSSYSGASVTATVTVGGVTDTSNWSFSKVDSSGITSSLSGATITVTNMTNSTDSGYVELSATRPGYPTQTVRLSIVKIKAATPAPAVSVSPSSLSVDAVATTGQVLSYAGKTITFTVNRNGVDETASWSFSAVGSSGCTVSVSANVVTLTGLTNTTDYATINVTATRSGYQTMYFAPTVVKYKNLPTPGIQNFDSSANVSGYAVGAAGTAYAMIRFTKDGAIQTSTDNGGTWSNVGNGWYYPVTTDVGASHIVDAYVQSGTLTANGGSGLLTATRVYTLTQVGPGIATAKVKFRVRQNLATYLYLWLTVDLSAIVEST